MVPRSSISSRLAPANVTSITSAARCHPLSRHSQSPSAPATRITTQSDPRHQVESPVRPWTRDRRLVARGQHANVVTVAMARALVGFMWAIAQQVPLIAKVQNRAASTPNSEGSQGASAETQPRCGGILGGVRRRVQETRAESEAGTRRRHGRWEPTHEEQQEQPSHIAGSGSFDAPRSKKQHEDLKKSAPHS